MDSKLDPATSLFQLNDFSTPVFNIESKESSACGSEMLDCKEILTILGIDLFDCTPNELIENLYPEPMSPSSDILSETVILHIIESLDIDGVPGSHTSLLNGPVIPFLFEEIEFADVTSHSWFTSDIYGSALSLDQLPVDNLKFGSFNEMIVCHELCPVSDTFKSLPIPVVLGHEIIETHYDIIVNILASVMEHPLSTCDGIYLDWPLWDEDWCKTFQFSIVQNILKRTDPCSVDFHDNSANSGLLDIDFVFENDSDEVIMEEQKLSLDFIPRGISFPDNEPEFNSNQLFKNGSVSVGNVESLSGINTEKVVQLYRNSSKFSDLNFLLNLQSGASEETDKPPEIPQVSSNVILQCTPLENQTGQWIVHLFEVHLTDNIVVLVDNFRKCFFSMLGNRIDLIPVSNPSLSEDNYDFLCISEKMLHDITNTEQIHLVDDNEQTKVLKSMCVIKRISWCLCFYGVYPAHQIFENLLKSQMDFNIQFCSLYSLVEDEMKEIKKDVVKSHPSLSAIKEILLSSTQSSKVLIVTEMIFWNQLRLLFASMGLLYHDLDSERKNKGQVDKNYLSDLIHTVDNLLRHFNCLLVSPKHVYETFPFNKFNTIVEYGGSCNSSRIARTLQSTDVHNLYFVKLNVENHKYINGQFCSEIDYDDEDAIRICSFEHLKMFTPIEGINNVRSSHYEHGVSGTCLSNASIPISKSVDNVQFGSHLFNDTIVVVNTRDIDKEMLVSKRTTYQRILALEKKGTQVVERDLTLPVDIIISPTVCVLWYDCNNIGKSTSLQHTLSFISEYVDNIAANIFSLLSFCFKSCILVFEGDHTFLLSIMEYSDGLYAAAASLGINLQIFFSHSCEMTAHILLGCIGNVSTSKKVKFTRFPEAETLAEAFLTKFPSVNVFIAISILSSVDVLVDYFNWTPERRILEAQNYHIHDENIILFNLLCGYGDIGNSVSGVTDCSSSTSLGPDTASLHSIAASRKRKRKFTEDSGPSEITMPVGELLNVSPLDIFSGSEMPTLSSTKTIDYCMQKYKTFNDSKQPHFYDDGVIQSDIQQNKFVCEFDENFSSIAEPTYFPRDLFDLDMPTTKSCKDMKSVFLTESYPDFSPIVGAAIKDTSGFVNGNDNSTISHVDAFQKDICLSNLTRPNHNKTAFSDAICSGEPPIGSSWTTKFLNSVREKQKARQKSFSQSSAASSFHYSERSSSSSKRRSPSYIDLFRYRGGRAHARNIGPKNSRLPRTDSSKNSGSAYVLPSTWTPLDKKSKKVIHQNSLEIYPRL